MSYIPISNINSISKCKYIYIVVTYYSLTHIFSFYIYFISYYLYCIFTYSYFILKSLQKSLSTENYSLTIFKIICTSSFIKGKKLSQSKYTSHFVIIFYLQLFLHSVILNEVSWCNPALESSKCYVQ